jgi:hypothetical protein
MENWPIQIPAAELYEDSLRHASESAIVRKLSHEAFGMKIMKLIPDIRKTRPRIETPQGLKRVWSYVLPSLDECRRYFEKVMGQAIDWPQIADDEVPEDARSADVPV